MWLIEIHREKVQEVFGASFWAKLNEQLDEQLGPQLWGQLNRELWEHLHWVFREDE